MLAALKAIEIDEEPFEELAEPWLAAALRPAGPLGTARYWDRAGRPDIQASAAYSGILQAGAGSGKMNCLRSEVCWSGAGLSRNPRSSKP
jgi:hypothetical protein